MANTIAPEGQIYVCTACGKTSQDLHGNSVRRSGWDESCVLNAVLCHKDKLVYADDGKRVSKVEDGGVVE